MDIKFKIRDTFYICGYLVETSLETCEKDLCKLWRDFDTKKEELFNIFGYRNDFYGLMWYTDNHRYYNLIGIEADNINKKPTGACGKCVPGTNHSVAHVPPIMSAVDAWTEYFEKTLPESGYFIVFLPTLQILT